MTNDVVHRARRADARRNRERLIRAGMEILIEEGPGATVSAIARRADLSDSSFFTYFASKEDLIAALVTARVEALQAIAQRNARGAGTAMERLERYIWEGAEDIAPHRGYLEVANQLGVFTEASLAAAEALHVVLDGLVANAEREGALRPGVTSTDVNSVIMIATLAAAPYLHGRPQLWRRFVALFIAGLRADVGERLPGQALGPSDIYDTAAAWRHGRADTGAA